MLLGSYLLVITERECVGSYLGHPIFKVSSLKVLPCDHSLKNSTAEQVNLLWVYFCFLPTAVLAVLNFLFSFTNLAEKDGGWVFWPYKCSREGFWSVFFVWHKFNSEVTYLSQLNSIFFFVCMCLCVLLACMCVVNMLPESRPRWLVAGCLGLALWWLTDLKGSTLFFGTYSSLKL